MGDVVRGPQRDEPFGALVEVVEVVKPRVLIWKDEWCADGTSEFVEGCSIAEDVDTHDHGEAQRTP